MRADGPTVVDRLAVFVAGRFKRAVFALRKAQFTGQHFLGKVTFADEKRDHENTPGKHATQHGAHARFQFPKCLLNLRENVSIAECVGVLVGGAG